MSFDEKDITILKQMFDEQSRDLRDYTDSRFANSEKRMDEMETRIIDAISDSHDMLVKPRLDNHELRITKLESGSPVHTS